MRLQIPSAFSDLFIPKRYKIYHGGRGGAKSWAFGTALTTLGMIRPLRILCTRELQNSIADSVHKLLSDIIGRYPEMSAFYDIQKKNIYGLNGTEFLFKGLRHNINEIRSTEGVDICWVEEAQIVSDASWEILIPTIRKEGSEIWASLNLKRPTDPTYQRFIQNQDEDMLVRKVSWRDNPFFPSTLEKERTRLQKTDPEAYQHVWEGEFDVRHFGGVYSKKIEKALREGRIKSGIFDPSLRVGTVWDLGFGDATAVWFYQICGREVRWIDYLEANQEDPQFYAEKMLGYELVRIPGKTIKEDRYEKGKPLEGDVYARRRQYVYGDHFGPHDAANKLLQAGGRSFIEQLNQLTGFRMRKVNATSQLNSEEALKLILDNSWFDKDYTKDGVHALTHYHYKYDEDKKTFKEYPEHDWSSHGCDAAELLGQVMKEQKAPVEPDKPKFLEQMTANEIFWPGGTGVETVDERI